MALQQPIEPLESHGGSSDTSASLGYSRFISMQHLINLRFNGQPQVELTRPMRFKAYLHECHHGVNVDTDHWYEWMMSTLVKIGIEQDTRLP